MNGKAQNVNEHSRITKQRLNPTKVKTEKLKLQTLWILKSSGSKKTLKARKSKVKMCKRQAEIAKELII